MCSDQTNSGRLDPRKGYWSMTTPCNNCPFRNDKPPFGLRPGRVREIAVALERTTFTCHKTTVHNDDDDDPGMIDGPNARHCAGALILMEKNGSSSQMMRIAERLGLYDPKRLDLDAPVYDDWEAAAAAQEEIWQPSH
jgi:hypothetical protein